jgi:hypothetical protein
MEYVVYCDESRQDGSLKNPFMTIGSLWLPRDKKNAITQEFKHLCREFKLNSEIKWSKTSQKSLNSYKKLVDFFFKHPEINYRVIVVDQRKVDAALYHRGDQELGFYKFYYLLLIQWLTQGNQYLILLDFKQNKGSDRYSMLRTVLDRKLKGTAWISDLTIIDSAQTPLAQLCDLLTGAVSSTWCNDLKPKSAKEDLALYIAQKCSPNSPPQFQSLKVISSSPSISKFNIFKIDLK